MKRWIFLCVLLPFLAFGQAWRWPKDAQEVMPKFDTWYCLNRDSVSGHRSQEDRYIRNINAGDSIWTMPFNTRAYMDLEVMVADSAATDSVILYVELWQGNVADSSEANFSKTYLMSFSNSSGSIADQDSLTTTGIWYCDLNRYEYRSALYSRLLIFTGANHSISNGAKAKFEFSSPPVDDVP